MLEDEGVLWNLSQPFSVFEFYKTLIKIFVFCARIGLTLQRNKMQRCSGSADGGEGEAER